MLTSFLQRWFAPPTPTQQQLPMCVPEWSEAMAQEHASIWWRVKPYTMTGVERVVALCQSIAYLENHNVSGDIVECGVRRGGSIMTAALALLACDSTTRQLYLYDTFTGMSDVDCQGPLGDVKQLLMQTRYPWEKLIFIEGRVEETIPRHLPDEIALLRLDTDWYESTYHELVHLYPRLVEGGILIVDDYGHGRGARKAVDDYFRTHDIDADLRTIDYTGRLLIKRSRLAMAA